MILSVSRRTDIPNYYAPWFYKRLQEGLVCVRNPVSPHRVSRIRLSPDTVDCIVFWTKNPEGMLYGLSELEPYPYYFQFTLTGYGREIEPGIPNKRHLLTVFKELSRQVGRERVVWRYDPIFISRRYPVSYHLHAFGEIAKILRGSTDTVVISFLDVYEKIKRHMEAFDMRVPTGEQMVELAASMARIAAQNDMRIEACAEQVDLTGAGVLKGHCIDKARIERLIGSAIRAAKDPNQRTACGCMESIDIGAYNTCKNGCAYCYANAGEVRVLRNGTQYDEMSPLLCSRIGPEDVVSDRQVISLRTAQYSLF